MFDIFGKWISKIMAKAELPDTYIPYPFYICIYMLCFFESVVFERTEAYKISGANKKLKLLLNGNSKLFSF